MARVLVTMRAERDPADAWADTLEAAGHELTFRRGLPTTPPSEVIEWLRGCVAVVAAGEPYTAEVFRACPELRQVARFGVGFDAIDLAAATEQGVVVTTTPGGNDWAVADHAFSLLLNLAHGVALNDRRVKAGGWGSPRGVDVWQRTIGIIGLGRIGKGVARRARGFDMRVLVCEPDPDREFVDAHGLELVSLDTLLRRSDFVSVHVPLSPETTGLIDGECLSMMKPTAYLINTARGPIVDEDALYDALASGRIAGAGLDVRAVEPGDARFAELDNVVLTPHSAANTDGAWDGMGRMAVGSILSTLRGERPHGLLNSEVWERRRR